MVQWVIGSIPHGGAISRSSQCSMTDGMCYPVCGMVHIKEPLLLIEKSRPCGGGGGWHQISTLALAI